jgi:hypothetical protein
MIGVAGGPRLRVLLSIAVASLLACSSAQAATVTVGSPLTASFLPGTVGAPGIVGINSVLGEPGAHATSPVDGAVIGWKVLGEGGPFELRVLRPEGAGTYLGVAAGAPETLGTYGLGTFTTDLPIKVGEIVAIQAAENARLGTAIFDAPGSSAQTWAVLPESVAAAPDGGAPESEVGFSATVLPAPTVASVAPTSGPIAGGTSVTVTGTDFTEVEGVSFGSVPAAGYSVTSEGQLTAVAPAGTSAGSVPVSVTTEAGTASSAQSFTYSAPPAASTDPPSAPPAQPTPECVVPKLKGKKLKAVRKIVAKADCKLGKVTKKGTAGKRAKVVKQKPKAGTIRAARSKINVVLGGR